LSAGIGSERINPISCLVVGVSLLVGCTEPSLGAAETESQKLPSPSVQTSTPTASKVDYSIVEAIPQTRDLLALRAHIRAIEAEAEKLEPLVLEYTMGPTAAPDKVELVTSKFAEKLKIFQLLGLEKLNLNWVLVSEKDYEWWLEYRTSRDPEFPVELWDPQTNLFGHCRLSSDVFCGAGNSGDGFEYQDNIVGTRFVDRGLDYVTRHEAAHFYQGVFGYGGRCWMAEGQATFFETYLETSSRSRREVLQRLRLSPAGIADLGREELFARLTDDSICSQDFDVAYDLGMLAYEFFYMNYSLRQVHDLHVLSTSIDWEKAVNQALSHEASALSLELAEYIFENVNG
jgi:hypothetical protein